MTVVEEIKDRADIVEIIGESVKLKKSGKNYTGFCPFHTNTRTPAFVVFPDTGTWRCFGACNEGGDVYRFLMKKEGWDFPESLRYMAERTGIELRPRTPEQEAAEEEHQALREILESAAVFYRNNLLHQPQVLDYLRGRGLTHETLERFGIGYAPDAWDATQQFLSKRGATMDQLLEVGLVVERDGAPGYDRFRNRITIPIRDVRGRMAGFGARIVDPQDQPKFLNSPQTALFDKGRLLYGLDSSRKGIRQADQAVVVEGYLDVIGLHQAGYPNAVSPMGTALTAEQLRLLKRHSRNIVLALDADTAGDRATLRGLSLAREALDREAEPVFDARGLVRIEGRLDAEIRVLALPEGKDPDDVVIEDPEAWRRLLGAAKPVVDYVMDVLLADQDVNDAKVKASVADQVMPLIEDVADSVEREAYRQELARRLKVDERALLEWRSAPRRAAPVERTIAADGLSRNDRTATEAFCLGLLLRDPELTYWVDRTLGELELEGLSSADFFQTDSQLIFQAVRTAISQVDEEPKDRWRSLLEGPTLDQALAYTSTVEEVDFNRPKVKDAVSADFLRLRMRRVEGRLEELSYQQDAVREQGAPEEQLRHLTEQAQALIAQKRRLDRALGN